MDISLPMSPPPDTSPPAIRFLLAFFVIEALQWGFPITFGVFQDYYTTHPPFSSSSPSTLRFSTRSTSNSSNDNSITGSSSSARAGKIALIGTLATGIVYLGAPPMVYLVRRYPRWHLIMIWGGWLVSIVALVGASFAKTVGGLVATQGALYGIGFLPMHFAIAGWFNEWWVRRRGMAYGVLFGATGVSGCVMPFVLEILLSKYGYQTTLRAFAVTLTVLSGPVVPFFKPRLRPEQHLFAPKAELSYLKEPLFWVFAGSVFFQGLGYFFPSIFLPSFATALGYSHARGALLLALLFLAQVLGQFVLGWMSDGKVQIEILAFLFPLASAVVVFALWGVAHSFATLAVFAFLYGFSAGGYNALWARMGMKLSDQPSAGITTYAIFCFLRGIGNVLTGPVSGRLIREELTRNAFGIGRYRNVVCFTGASMVSSSLCVGIWLLCRKAPRLRIVLGRKGAAQ